jgi:hypothetical protein
MQTLTTTEKGKNTSAVFLPKSKHQPFFAPAKVQPKLTIGAIDDTYEREADAMADRVMRMPSPLNANFFFKPANTKTLQRKCSGCEEENKRKQIMRKEAGINSGLSDSSSFASTLSSSKGGGSPLPKATKSFMETAFRTDFSSVKIHTDSQASEMSKIINAKAFTYGNDIYFREGQYDSGSGAGKQLLAHELTHVVQQGGGLRSVQRTPAHTYTFISRGSYGETTPGFRQPSCAAGAAAGTSTLAAGSASPTVTVFPNGTYSVRRNDGVEQTATCRRLAAGLALTRAHEDSHAAGARTGVTTANTAQGLPRNFPDAAACSAALPGILTAWNTTVDTAWANEVSHGPGTNQPTAQTFTDENAAGTCTFT